MLLNRKKRMEIGGLLITGLISIIFASSAYAAEDPATISAAGLSISLNADTIPDEFWDMGVDFEVRKDNSVMGITVTGRDVATYQDIHVGDPINKVRSKYLMEYEEDDWVAALISGDTELDTGSVMGMDEDDFTDEILDAVFLQYTYEDDLITKIYIARIYSMLGMDRYVNPDAEAEDVQLERNQVYVNGEILTYNEVVPDSLKIFAAESPFSTDIPEDAPVKIITNEEGAVRGIQVFGRNVQTYDGITVGMDKTDIFATYDKYVESPGYVSVYYNGDELLADEDLPADDYFCYSYRTDDDGTITNILICDQLYATMMK